MPDEITQERNAQQVRSSVFSDGKRRVTVAQRTRIFVGHQTIVKRTDEVISDPELIATLEANGVELIDLDVNGRPAFTKRQMKAQEDARLERVDALAAVLDIIPTTLREALEKGKYEAQKAVRDGLEERYTRDLKIELAALQARVAELEAQAASAVYVDTKGTMPAQPASAPDGPTMSDLAGS